LFFHVFDLFSVQRSLLSHFHKQVLILSFEFLANQPFFGLQQRIGTAAKLGLQILDFLERLRELYVQLALLIGHRFVLFKKVVQRNWASCTAGD